MKKVNETTPVRESIYYQADKRPVLGEDKKETDAAVYSSVGL